MKILTVCGVVTDILILIGILRCLKQGKTMNMVLGVNVNLKLIFSNIYCWYTLELPHRGNSNMYLQYMCFTISFLDTFDTTFIVPLK